LVALLGHGIARGDDFYYLSWDARGRGSSRDDVHLSQSLKEGLRDSADLNGLRRVRCRNPQRTPEDPDRRPRRP
jgi:hypothetical protein